MTWLHNFNPFYLRKKLRETKEELNRRVDLCRNYEQQINELWVEVKNTKEKLHITKIELEAKTDEASELDRRLGEYQTRVNRLGHQLRTEKQKNQKWFEVFLGFSQNDFTLLNQTLRGQELEFIPEYRGAKKCK